MFKMNKDSFFGTSNKLNVTNLSIRQEYGAFTVQSAKII